MELCSIIPWWLRWKRICLQSRRPRFSPWVRKIPWRRKWLSTPAFLPGEFHGREAWQATAQGITGIWTRLTNYHWEVNHGLPWRFRGKESSCQHRKRKFDSWVRKIPWRTKWPPTLVFLPGKSHGQRNLAGYSPWGRRRDRHNLVTKKQVNQAGI